MALKILKKMYEESNNADDFVFKLNGLAGIIYGEKSKL